MAWMTGGIGIRLRKRDKMSDVIIFGGTTEGRLLAEYCVEMKIPAVVCVTSGYGQQVLPESPWLTVSRKAMAREEMAELIKQESPKMVLDATHPYAAVVTEQVTGACEDRNTRYVRIARAKLPEMEELGPDQAVWVDCVEEAAEYLKKTEGPVFVTTGSKELGAFTGIPEYEKRIYARVLPDSGVLNSCEALGIRGRHVMGMQGPFSKEINAAMLRHTGARYLVTKEAGAAGGFIEKLEAAWECGVVPVVIGRPGKPDGISVDEGFRLLGTLTKAADKPTHPVRLNLVGIGMGGSGQLTLEAAQALKHSEAVLGAPRMLQSIEGILEGGKTVPYYLSKDVREWIEHNGEYHRISVVYSGDTGFYSAAKMLLEDLRVMEEGRPVEVRVYPGISTVSYLSAKLRIPWDGIYLASAHGRSLDVIELVKKHEKIFLLLGGEDSVRNLCRRLTQGGCPQVQVYVGERLSYDNERITAGTAAQLQEQEFDSLAAVVLCRQ